MNQSLQSYTPTAHPLNYDALASREGCDADTGNQFFNALPFTTVCVFEHDAGNMWFSQPDTVSKQLGPQTTGVPHNPQVDLWTAWVSGKSIRIGLLPDIVPPSPGKGFLSDLFPSIITTKVTHCFDDLGLLHMAVELANGYIRLKHYTDGAGTKATIDFPGRSPMLFNLVNLDPEAGVVCYYVRESQPFVLFARFSQEAFATEHIVMPRMRCILSRLVYIQPWGNKLRLYARDDIGRDVTLTTVGYATHVTDAAADDIEFESGIITQVIVPVSIVQGDKDKAKIGTTFSKGFMRQAVVTAKSPTKEKARLGVVFEEGEIIRAL